MSLAAFWRTEFPVAVQTVALRKIVCCSPVSCSTKQLPTFHDYSLVLAAPVRHFSGTLFREMLLDRCLRNFEVKFRVKGRGRQKLSLTSHIKKPKSHLTWDEFKKKKKRNWKGCWREMQLSSIVPAQLKHCKPFKVNCQLSINLACLNTEMGRWLVNFCFFPVPFQNLIFNAWTE